MVVALGEIVLADKIALLLADSDALRRDGIAAVVQEAGGMEVVAHCADGLVALQEIRALEPDVAIIDLNLSKLHGIEVIRQVRNAQLRTKVIVVSGSDDDDIIREVVRAGGDGFLLKNGPARHLLDAINYVRDGGQYFSPHLRRDGLDRQFLQERPQQAAYREEPASAESKSRDVRRSSAGQLPIRETLRERIEEDQNHNLEDRDYEILSMMAEGIRPILDRLGDIEGRVNGMETGLEPVPTNPAGWLSRQFADTLQRGGGRQADVAHSRTSVREMEARLPQLIEETVSQRFHSMAGKLQKEIEESHIKTLETFVKNIQVKLVNRVSALEKDMSLQAENMNQLRESSQRTEDNLSRLIHGVDKLAQELPKRLQDAAAAAASATPRANNPVTGRTSVASRPESKSSTGNEEPSLRRPQRSRSSGRNMALLALAAVVVLIGVIWFGARTLGARGGAGSATAAASGKPGETTPQKPVNAGTDTKSKMEAADDYVRRKEYPMAEEIYRQVVKSEPRNVDAMKGLASVLYRQDKIEESAAILDKIPAQ